MGNHPLACPYCSHTADSYDSYADSQAALNFHILSDHQDELGENYGD